MEVLTPIEQIPFERKEPTQAEPVTEAGIPLKHVEFLSELGLKDQLFNDSVMEKISFISEKTDLEGLKELALMVGNDGWTSRLDKIYTYLQLSKEKEDYKKKVELIDETLKNYGQPNRLQ
jgi:hypothetical protein